MNSRYSWSSRLTHYLALNSPVSLELTFDLERNLTTPANEHLEALHVTGLARAGTTAFLKSLHSSGQFATQTYKDMPFILAPNLWHHISKNWYRDINPKERAHKDGIEVDINSPEAFDEVFWRLHCGHDYITDSFLRVHEVSEEVLYLYHEYKNLVCHKYNKKKYLSKNNNHLLRIQSLVGRSNRDRFLIIFRNPIDQSYSLLEQNENFSNIDKFTQRYMSWLSHFEFGDTHRPYRIYEDSLIEGPTTSLDYWIDRWMDAYSYLVEISRKNSEQLIFVGYERLCSEQGYKENLFEWLGVSKSQFPLTPKPGRQINLSIDPEKLSAADLLYQQMLELSLKVIPIS